jgi:hypothetical protein
MAFRRADSSGGTHAGASFLEAGSLKICLSQRHIVLPS